MKTIKVVKTIKMKPEFFEMIKDGKKKLEFRKLEKGITSGTYKVVSTFSDDFFYGFIKLTPLFINPDFEKINDKNRVELSDSHWQEIDDETYNFVMENYVMKDIDFIVYAVDIVEEGDE